MKTEDIKKAFSEFIDEHFGGSSREVPIIKQLNDEKMEAIEWLYPVDQDDAHGERMSQEEVVKMVASLNKANENGTLSPNIGHSVNTDGWQVVKAWVNECDCMIGDTFVPEGWPLVKTKFTDEYLWKARKEGRLAGLSIGAKGSKEEEIIEDE